MKSFLSIVLFLFTGYLSFGQTLLTENFDSYQGFGDNLTGGWSSGQFKVYVRSLTSTTTTKLCQVSINQFHKTDSLTTPAFGPLAATASMQFQSRLCSYTGSFPTLGYVPGIGDKVVAFISSDGGTTYELLQDMTPAYTQTGNAFTDFTIPITGREGQTVKLKFKVVKVTTGTEWYTDFDNFEITNITSVQPLRSTVDFTIFPNPTTSRTIEIKARDLGEKSRLEIFNILGNKVFRAELKPGQTKVDLSELESGIYLVRLTDGKATSTQRLVFR